MENGNEIKNVERGDNQERIPSILESVTDEYIAQFQPPHIRYYETKYLTKFSTESLHLDTCIRVHSNRICVVFLSPKHSIYQKQQRVKSVNFQINVRTNRSENKTSGKGKKGAQNLTPKSVLCYLETDEEKYPVYCGMHGKLLETNKELSNQPNLVVEDNISDGYIAVVLCDLKKFEDDLNNLKNSEEYCNN